jgi:hypothetical protein
MKVRKMPKKWSVPSESQNDFGIAGRPTRKRRKMTESRRRRKVTWRTKHMRKKCRGGRGRKGVLYLETINM